MPAENTSHTQSDLPQEASIFSELWAAKQRADRLWNKGIEPGVEYGDKGDNLYSHVARIPGVKIEQLDKILTREGNFIFSKGRTFSFEKVGWSKNGNELLLDSDLNEADISDGRLSLEGFYKILKSRFEPLFDLINASADLGYEAGFNNHGGLEHILPVTDTALELVKKAGGSVEDQKLVIAGGLAHDLGMLLGRKLHHFVSSRIAFALAPELAKNQTIAARIRKVIILHDEGFAKKYTDILAAKHGRDTKEFYDAMRDKFGLAALALIAADKADVVDRRRATRKLGVGTEALMEDAQTVVAALADQRGYETVTVPGGSETKEIQTRTLLFSPYLSEVEQKNLVDYQPIPESHKDEMSVPLEYRNLNRGDERNGEGGGIPHFYSWMADIWKYHANRFGLEARSLFALFPHLDEYLLDIRDDSAWEKVGFKMAFAYRVHHEEVEEYVNFLKSEMAFPDKKPRTLKTLPLKYRDEAKRVERLNVENLVHAFRDSMSELAQIKRTLWRSESGKSTLTASYDFKVTRQTESLEAHRDKLFKPYVHRV